jgi:hypothetical protein
MPRIGLRRRLQTGLQPETCVAIGGMVPGGRIELPTPAFSGPRSTSELPRRRATHSIVRARAKRVNFLGEAVVTHFEPHALLTSGFFGSIVEIAK